MERISAVRGVKDILPGESARWRAVEDVFRAALEDYGYGEIRLPIFEETVLFQRGIGTDTDIVEKEMYTFADKGGKSITLRPEGTASAVRAFLEHGMDKLPPPVKLYYLGPMFRHERPQKGRLRQFHQVGAEIFGLAGPEAEAEMLAMLTFILGDRLGLAGLALEVNSLGDDVCRPSYRAALRTYLSGREKDLCENCRRRTATNPLRVLDCKAEPCREVAASAPEIAGYLCDPCRAHFDAFLGLLREYGVAFRVNRHLVRGLDYYTRTTFEVVSGDLGAQNAVAAGGRYDNLVAMFGGPPTPGLGWALGMERLLALVGEGAPPPRAAVYVAAIDEPGRKEARLLAGRLRREGVKADLDYQGRSLKAQMRSAGSLGAAAVVILGGEELARGEAVVKTMAGGEQRNVPLAGLADGIKSLLAKG